jgi:glycerophosphoryl diester phosphodiesterase
MIELDVRISQDGHIIVLHDRTLQRTSTGNGSARNYTLGELKEFDAGSWFHPSYASERIPTLAEVLRLAKGKTWMNIELKRDFFSRDQSDFVRRVIETVRSEGVEDQVLYSSFTHDLLSLVRRVEPKAVTGVIYNIYRDFGRSPSKLAGRVNASVFVCAKRELQKSMIRDAREHDMALYVYTLNSIQDARKMIQLGVDGIISDNADGIVAALKGPM